MNTFSKIGALTSKPYAFNARPWELKNINTIDIFDSFGSSIRLDFRDKEILRVLPRKSEWISDKVRFFYDSLKYQRFHYIYIKRKTILIKSNFYQILFFFKLITQNVTLSSFLFKISSLTDLESIFSAKSLFHTFLKRGNISNLENEEKSFFNSNLQQYFLNVKNLNSTDLLLFIDLNLRFENPILNSIVRKQIIKRSDLKVFALGSTLSYNFYIKHLSNDINVLKNIINGKHKFNLIFMKAIKPLILFGDSFFKRQYSFIFFSWMNKLQLLNNELIYKHLVNNIGNLGYNELGTINSNFNYLNKDLIINFNIGGHKMLKDNTNIKNTILIYQSSNYSDLALISDIILPEASFIEKESMFFTINNGLSTTKKVYDPSKEARDGIVFLQYFLFLSYKLPLNDETFLIKELINLKKKDFKNLLRTRLFKRSFFDKKHRHSEKLGEPFLTCLFSKSIFSNVINLYYSNDLLSKGSFNLNVRSKIEESNFLNFEHKNVIN
jgi:NADH-quinone oxidoreductase subunit G